MEPAIRLLASLVRGLVFLVLAGVGVFGCNTIPGGGLTPLPEAGSPKSEVRDQKLEVRDQKSEVRDQKPEIKDDAGMVLTSDFRSPTSDLPPPTPDGMAPLVSSRPLQILALSGGVAGAPFTAGILAGWTRTGTRPMFDQVTGISSGSLIGAYAFLGPKYDARMQQLIVSLNAGDLIRFRPLCCMVWDGAFGSAKPAERLFLRAYDDDFIADLRCAYAQGRRFYVGTMNLETKRLAIWDIGAIASSGRPDANHLVRKVLLAAVSWPGAVPPVPFDIEVNGHCYREEHCDAGSVAMVMPPVGPLPHSPAGANLYVLESRKLYSDPEPVPKRACCRLKPSVTAIFEALTRADINHLYSLCLLTGIRFHLLALPQGYHGEPLGITHLYPKEAPQLFEMGYHIGGAGPCWRVTPPGAEAGEAASPRDGREIRCGGW